MDTATKTYYSYGYKIVRKYHYVDAHQHYDYIVKVTDKEETFTSTTEYRDMGKPRKSCRTDTGGSKNLEKKTSRTGCDADHTSWLEGLC